MHKRLASRHNRTTLSPARTVRRTSMRSLRHHAARAGLSPRHAAPASTDAGGGLLRTWLHAVLAALRTGTRARRLLLGRLLRRTTVRRAALARAKRAIPAGNRRPRRLSASAGWFAFAAR